MKLVSYLYQGQRSYGIARPDGIIDLGRRLGLYYADLKALLSAQALEEARMLQHYPADLDYEQITFLPVIDNPGKILCVGMNYPDKRREFAQQDPAPTLFIRFADSQAGHMTPLLKPLQSQEFDYEGELAVIIGRGGSAIPHARALDHIAGYSCYMDGSVRDWQHSWFTAGKNWSRTGAFGPWLVTRDEIPDPQHLRIRTWLNGSMVQEESTAAMIHPISRLVEYISTFTVLSPGDVIITGSPGGVGKKRTPPLFMHPGDCIEVDIERVGHLTNRVAEGTL
ncbi:MULTISPECIES: fumarylacetoacetate hydrolase family protein [Edwardsiella]|uniref:Fumarylacetoacetate hydrolase family protein n=2 Tax=Edwardsiella anguillarum TaxID=1821960 RepID=A0A076LW88_9GAMM|nr:MULTISPECIES: fumarylacetoacetate hydrolase family protein [Edwardsiella]AKM48143.1 5-oxopent-3-ene-1,2,5-tricarboxylate decarboxylase [Edwardsiella sp. EA181011]GAJ66651.1 fumarylacetoacetate FAA hydrolase family protein [Edwardsiella piscicida]AIJ09754.1 Fumarylacetoacetate hydrolase family protein [Edwardsiella anguillarum ET080813]AKR77463.1 fumarylacetoacetate hydrolase family protein [Edwardsiella sp. LADL05-105]KAB0592692.1 fumarylacetoacetate hydrolase family protein [Edwardsiella a